MSKCFYEWFFSIAGYSILFAAIIGIIRFKKIHKSFHPFIFFTLAAFANEVASTYLIARYKNNAVNSNIYVLIEFLLLLWLFKNWGDGYRQKVYYLIIGIVLSIVWVLDNLVLHPIYQFTSIYRIFYSYVLVLLSMDYINYILFTEKRSVFYNTDFIICLGTLIFFSFRALLEIFYLFKLPMGNIFYDNLLLILNTANLLSNLLYAVAMLWLPNKRQFILPY